jgi:hypothetical protein
MKKGSFSCRKRATKGSSFFGLENNFLNEDLKWNAGNSFKKSCPEKSAFHR